MVGLRPAGAAGDLVCRQVLTAYGEFGCAGRASGGLGTVEIGGWRAHRSIRDCAPFVAGLSRLAAFGQGRSGITIAPCTMA